MSLLEDIHVALEGAQSLDTIQEDPEDVLVVHPDVPDAHLDLDVHLDPDVSDVQEDTPELMHL